jgi:hypothetical protein
VRAAPRPKKAFHGVLLPAALSAAVLGACGKKSDPLPPLRPTPQPVTGLTLSQVGDRVHLALVAPRAGTDGTRLGILEVELQRAEGDGDFKTLAKKRVLKVAPGEAIEQDEPLPKPGTLLRVSARAVSKGRPSLETLPVSLTVRAPLGVPRGLTAALVPAGVELRWSGETTESGGFRLYRRGPVGAFGPPLTPAPLPGPPYLDATAATGQKACYVVRGVASTDPPVESAASEEACVDVKDLAPPTAPAGLTAVVEGGAVALSWSPSMDVDLAHYRVYRSVERGVPERLAELPVTETSYRDETLAAGAAARYTVTAVDAAGNESPPSAAAPARIP